MNFQQLRVVMAIFGNGLSLTEAARVLSTSQSGVSKQIQNLEAELGIEIFVRKGKRLVGVTQAGQGLIEIISKLLVEAENVRIYSSQFKDQDRGRLVIGATHNQAVNALPLAIKKFSQLFPKVTIEIRQAMSEQIAQMVVDGVCDLAVATEGVDKFPDLVTFPYYSWTHIAIVPQDHDLARLPAVTLEDLAAYPIITYDADVTGRSHVDTAFRLAGLHPEIRLTAMDADVIKCYAATGLGVGIVAETSLSADEQSGLKILPLAPDLFDRCVVKIALRRGKLFRSYIYQFIELLAPHLPERIISSAVYKGKIVEFTNIPPWPDPVSQYANLL